MLRLANAPKSAVVFPEPQPALDVAEAGRLFVDEGLRASEIARRLGFSAHHIREVLRRFGLQAYRPATRTHRKWGEPLYLEWSRMREKCRRLGRAAVARRGAPGIDVAPEWTRFETFYAWAISSSYRPGRRLHRIDDSIGFTPANCRWIPASEQHRLRGEAARSAADASITAFGESKSLSEWSRDSRCVVNRGSLGQRLARGYRPEDAITKTRAELRGCVVGARPARPLSPPKRRLDAAKIRELHVEKLMSPPVIASRLKASQLGVLNVLKRLGVYRRPERVRDSADARRLYATWSHIFRACTNRKHADYALYGGRGATLCPDWLEFKTFRDWALRAGYRKGLWLTRKNSGKPFSPRNCEWVTRDEVRRRTRAPRPSAPRERWAITAFGETKGAARWARDRRCRVTENALRRRLREGMDPEIAISKPRAHLGRPGITRIRAFGEKKSVAEWSRDPRCRVTRTTLIQRLAAGYAPEDAIGVRRHEIVHRKRRARGHR